ncbi:hypothetical protein jhhlp_006498 [Lomentospora prolificans]|uniref:HhH-GPD domain-containing protein n=1 Tax=Lomentospora prolificans TaxID=41688 RepID=A0A2N3N622_9PEZI|nr:hypothetical protein jhhlp_006498 [Lomentospora prolificans]
MDHAQGQAYDPTRPWAVTDALLGILARSLLKSSYPGAVAISGPNQTPAAHPQHQQTWQQPTPRKAAVVTSQFWSHPPPSMNGVPSSIPATSAAVSVPTSAAPPMVTSADYSSNQHLLARASPPFHGAPDHGTYPSSTQHPTNNGQHRAGNSTNNPTNTNSNHGSNSGIHTPGHHHDDVSPMMIDPNLTAWHGDDEEQEHEQESFLHQYSEMGGDYTAVPANMIDPNLALLHDHEDYRHGRQDEDEGGHMDDLDGGHFGINFHQGRLRQRRSSPSPYFAERNTKLTQSQPTCPQPRRGTVSCIPYPPLTATSFGLIQEQLAHDPFRLLIAVTFLVKTKGIAPIPAFHQAMRRFPTPEMLADKNNANELIGMIRHLGLSTVRAAAIQRYAEQWIRQPPPKAGVR